MIHVVWLRGRRFWGIGITLLTNYKIYYSIWRFVTLWFWFCLLREISSSNEDFSNILFIYIFYAITLFSNRQVYSSVSW